MFWMTVLKQNIPAGVMRLSTVFKPLQSPPQVNIQAEPDELELDDLDFDPITVLAIQERTKAKLDKNKEHAHRALAYSLMLGGP